MAARGVDILASSVTYHVIDTIVPPGLGQHVDDVCKVCRTWSIEVVGLESTCSQPDLAADEDQFPFRLRSCWRSSPWVSPVVQDGV